MEAFQNYSIALLATMILLETVVRIKNGLTDSEKKDWWMCMFLSLVSLSISLTTKTFFLDQSDNNPHNLLAEIPMSFPLTMILFLIMDFAAYWYHRLAHGSRIFWASHVVHHSSNNFNLTVGIRESIVEGFYRLIYWSFFYWIGFPAISIFIVDGTSLIFQALLHTKYIGKLGVLENIINTPSSHRVHHSYNTEYLNKNFGGVLIIWDKIFSTYCKEVTQPRYGLTDDEPSYDPVKINFCQWNEIGRLLKKATTIKAVLHSLFGMINNPTRRNI